MPAHAQHPVSRGTPPAWVRVLEVANPYVSAGMDALGGASGHLQATKELRASEIARSEGNRAVRKVIAAERNALRQSGLVAAKAADQLGAAVLVADVAGTLAGHLAEGDLRAVPGVLANAAVKNVTTSGGAWAGGTAGAAAGSLLGPVGTLVGGAIGAAAGAVGASWGYDGVSEALARNGHATVQSYVDSLAAEKPVDTVEKARQARREHLEAQAAEQQRREARRADELPAEIEKAREARRELLEEQERRGEGAQKWHDKQDRRAEATPERPTPASPSDPSIPVIPVDCTIDVVVWHVGSPSSKWHGSFRVNGDTVTLHAETTYPGSADDNHRSSPIQGVVDFAGTRRDNIITGTSHATHGPTRLENWYTISDAKGNSSRKLCVTVWTTRTTAAEEWTLSLGGDGHLRNSGQSDTTLHYSSDCTYKPGETETRRDSSSDDGKLRFTWKIR